MSAGYKEVDSELLDKAHEIVLNVSKIAENALKDTIDRMERPKTQTDTANSLDKIGVARDVRFTPTFKFHTRTKSSSALGIVSGSG